MTFEVVNAKLFQDDKLHIREHYELEVGVKGHPACVQRWKVDPFIAAETQFDLREHKLDEGIEKVYRHIAGQGRGDRAGCDEFITQVRNLIGRPKDAN